MKLRSLLAGLLLAGIAIAVSVPAAHAWSEEVVEVNVVDEKGFRQGGWKITAHMKKLGAPWMPAQIVEEGNYIDSKQKGVWITYHQNGSRAAEIAYLHGRRDGVAKYFDVQGNIISASTFVNGVRRGLMTTYYPDGKMLMEFTWSDGRINGPAKTYYSNGNVCEEGTWMGRGWVNEYKLYAKNGSLIREELKPVSLLDF